MSDKLRIQRFAAISVLIQMGVLCLLPAWLHASKEDGRRLEEKILQAADRNIEKYRRSDAVIEVVAGAGLARTVARLRPLAVLKG